MSNIQKLFGVSPFLIAWLISCFFNHSIEQENHVKAIDQAIKLDRIAQDHCGAFCKIKRISFHRDSLKERVNESSERYSVIPLNSIKLRAHYSRGFRDVSFIQQSTPELDTEKRAVGKYMNRRDAQNLAQSDSSNFKPSLRRHYREWAKSAYLQKAFGDLQPNSQKNHFLLVSDDGTVTGYPFKPSVWFSDDGLIAWTSGVSPDVIEQLIEKEGKRSCHRVIRFNGFRPEAKEKSQYEIISSSGQRCYVMYVAKRPVGGITNFNNGDRK